MFFYQHLLRNEDILKCIEIKRRKKQNTGKDH